MWWNAAVYRAERPDRPVRYGRAGPVRLSVAAGQPVRVGRTHPEQQPKPAPETPAGRFLEEVRKFEIGLITTALERNQFNQKRAAEDLGLRYHQFRGYLRNTIC